MDILTIPKRCFTLSLMLIKTLTSFSALTPQPQRAKRNSERSGNQCAHKFLRSSTRMIFPTPICRNLMLPMNLISEESGNITESSYSESTLRNKLTKAKSLRKMHKNLKLLSACLMYLLSQLTSMVHSESSSTWKTIQATKPP